MTETRFAEWAVKNHYSLVKVNGEYYYQVTAEAWAGWQAAWDAVNNGCWSSDYPHLTVTTAKDQVVLVSWQNDEHQIGKVVWERDTPVTAPTELTYPTVLPNGRIVEMTRTQQEKVAWAKSSVEEKLSIIKSRVDAIEAQLSRPAASWCNHCGEGITAFCRGGAKTVCPRGLPHPGSKQ